MNLRDIFVENFAGDLEYHPRRAFLYFSLAVAAFCFWIFSPSNVQFTTVPLVFALGGLALQSSEGLGLSDQELAELSKPSQSQEASINSCTGQSNRSGFGTGSFLLWPLLNIGRDIDKSWSDPPLFRVFLIGATLFLIGWAVRRAFSTKELPTPG